MATWLEMQRARMRAAKAAPPQAKAIVPPENKAPAPTGPGYCCPIDVRRATKAMLEAEVARIGIAVERTDGRDGPIRVADLRAALLAAEGR